MASTADAPSLRDDDGSDDGDGVPDHVEEVLDVAAEVHQVEVSELGWPSPPPDGDRGGSAATDIYLSDFNDSSTWGYAATEPRPAAGSGRPSYLVIDDDFAPSQYPQFEPGEGLRVGLARDYNFVLQFGMNRRFEFWHAYATAVWAEHQVFPEFDQWVSYADDQSNLPFVSTASNSGPFRFQKALGSGVWNHWLDSGNGDFGPDVVLDAYARAAQMERPKAMAAYDAAIRAENGPGFERSFFDFAVDTTEWDSGQAGSIPRFDELLAPVRERELSLADPELRSRLDHTAYELMTIEPFDAAGVRLVVNGPRRIGAGAALVGLRSGAVEVVEASDFSARGGRLEATLSEPPDAFDSLTAVIVNSESRLSGRKRSGRDWIYAGDDQRFDVKVKAL